MGGWNRKSVMSPNLLVVDRNQQAGASPCDRATLPISLLYHYYTTNTTTIPQISLLYHSIIIPQFFCAGSSSPSAMAHAQNARAALRALVSSSVILHPAATALRLPGRFN